MPTKHWQQHLLQEWPNIIGELQMHMRIERIQGSCLVIGVYDPHWLHELFMLQQTILETITTALGGAHITTIRFVPISKPKNTNATLNTHLANKSQIRETRQLSPHHEQILTRIADESLKDILRTFFTNCVNT